MVATWKKLSYELDVITKALLTEQGDVIYASAASTPAALAHGTATQYLKSGGHAANPSWDTPAGGGPTLVRKTTDEVVNNNTLQDDNELKLTVAASEVLTIFMIIRGYSNSTADFRYLFTVPAGGAISGFSGQHIGILTQEPMGFVDLTSTQSVLGFPSSAAEKWIAVWGIYAGGANGGDLQLQWAQITTTAGTDTKVLTNSFIIAHKLA